MPDIEVAKALITDGRNCIESVPVSGVVQKLEGLNAVNLKNATESLVHHLKGMKTEVVGCNSKLVYANNTYVNSRDSFMRATEGTDNADALNMIARAELLINDTGMACEALSTIERLCGAALTKIESALHDIITASEAHLMLREGVERVETGRPLVVAEADEYMRRL